MGRGVVGLDKKEYWEMAEMAFEEHKLPVMRGREEYCTKSFNNCLQLSPKTNVEHTLLKYGAFDKIHHIRFIVARERFVGNIK